MKAKSALRLLKLRKYLLAASIVMFASAPLLAGPATATPESPAQELATLPLEESASRPDLPDWLLDPAPYRAGLYRDEGGEELALSNGLLRRRFRLEPNAATVGLEQLTSGASLLRAVKPEALVVLDGTSYEVGGLRGQPNHAFLSSEWVAELKAAEGACFRFEGFEQGPPTERMQWKRSRHHAPGAAWPPRGLHLRMDYRLDDPSRPRAGARLSVHYELYDGLPCYSKWLSLENTGQTPLTVDSFTSELLAAVEYGSEMELGGVDPRTPNLHVETDYAFCSMAAKGGTRHSVRWVADPEFLTQVSYQRLNPCLLEVGPTLGPAQRLAPGERFESFRAFVLAHDSTDRERCGLALRRMYRTVAPWVTENPLMMHVRWSDPETVRAAVDQCAEVGFEMLILTFGSGFNIEDESAEYLERMSGYADYARERGIEIGGYSLLASRHVGGGSDIVLPEGQRPTFGNSPCLESEWGQDYFRKLYTFYAATGFALLEHDGSYPGDPCHSEEHPGHTGFADSRWKQWVRIRDYYHWCRAQGIYLNVPDYYYLSGSSKSGMGYRETNWSLPRAQQVIHTRQNIFDGTWEKTPSMGWMFVPLTEYQGGGAAATIEPLDEHREHYARMLQSNLALGVQACYRGPRLYDSEATRDLVAEQVAWFRAHRDILESDLIHGRRADGREVDWMLHVNPRLESRALLVAFNPKAEAASCTLRPSLYYAGLTDEALASVDGGEPQRLRLSRDYRVTIDLVVPAGGMSWVLFEAP